MHFLPVTRATDEDVLEDIDSLRLGVAKAPEA